MTSSLDAHALYARQAHASGIPSRAECGRLADFGGIFMFYDRKIKYLEDRKDGERVRTAGFVKAEVRDEACRMTIHVAGLHGTDTFEKSVLALGGGREGRLCKIKIAQGQGDTGELCLHSGHLGEAGIPYAQLEEIRIPLAAGRELCCLWKPKAAAGFGFAEAALQADAANAGRTKPQPLESAKDEGRGQDTSVEAVVGSGEENAGRTAIGAERDIPVDRAAGGRERNAEPASVSTGRSAAEPARQADAASGNLASSVWQADAASEELQSPARQADAALADAISGDVAEPARQTDAASGDLPSSVWRADAASGESMLPAGSGGQPPDAPVCRRPPMEDKWNQLAVIYPHIAPFRDEREYLSIHPEDFVLLPEKYYPLVHNSFLLHAYHNYAHLILARMERRGEVRHYIGVPGVYHEKERQAAVLFGFESFECKTEPVRPGDYGYYMMRVEL